MSGQAEAELVLDWKQLPLFVLRFHYSVDISEMLRVVDFSIERCFALLA